MATIDPTTTLTAAGYTTLTWAAISTSGDTVTAKRLAGDDRVRGTLFIYGTFGGATAVLQGSPDGTNFATLKDTGGAAISATATGSFEFETCALDLKPAVTGGTGDDVTFQIIFKV